MGAGGDHPPVSVLDVDDAVAFDAKRAEAYPLQFLTGHGLDGISPDLGDLHATSAVVGLRVRMFPTAICAPLNNRPGDLEHSSTDEVTRADTLVQAHRLALCPAHGGKRSRRTVASEGSGRSDESWLQEIWQNPRSLVGSTSPCGGCGSQVGESSGDAVR